MMINLERDKYANVIQTELEKLNDEFSRYSIRWEKLKKDIDTVSNDVKDINNTSVKISKRFTAISNVKFEEKKESNNIKNLKILVEE